MTATSAAVALSRSGSPSTREQGTTSQSNPNEPQTALARDGNVDVAASERRRQLRSWATSLGWSALGLGILLLLWWRGGQWVASNPSTSAFADFAPEPTFRTLRRMIESGEVWAPVVASLKRIGWGLGYACVLGIPTGVLIGRVKTLQKVTNAPFQLLRMISPLSWMPIAVMAFATWEGAIVFLIGAASIWPIIFSTSNGISKIDPSWFAVARNLGALPWQVVTRVILPAAAQDILTGVRLAMGVAWVVLVPAEYLGVTSGLGYAINDARDTLEYDRLAAIVVVIGICGFLIDNAMRLAIARVNWNEEEI